MKFLIPIAAAFLLFIGTEVKAQDSDNLKASMLAMQHINDGIVDIASRTNPAVVTVFTEKTVTVRQVNPFDAFFGYNSAPREREYTQNGLGSGVIVTTDGYILTNNHVVGDADKIYVKMIAGDTLSAKVVGVDPNTDIAVIKVDRKELPIVPLGDSESLRVGELVFAVGSPLSESLNHTVTMGIVSAKGRSDVNITQIEDFIQTDAAINPGNSGGALVNIEGKLIGINTAIASRSGGNQGIGFAVPINMAKVAMNSIIKHGRVIRSFLGVGGLRDVDDKLVKALGLKKKEGIIVGMVVENSAAEKAGVQNGDIILKLNGKPVGTVGKFQSAIYSTAPGEKVDLLINRDGKERKISVELGELDEGAETVAAGPSTNKLEELTGFEVASLTNELRGEYDINRVVEGVIVTDIDKNRLAWQEGLRKGDVITSVNRRTVRDLADYRSLMENAEEGEYILLRVVRQNSGFYIPIRVGK